MTSGKYSILRFSYWCFKRNETLLMYMHLYPTGTLETHSQLQKCNASLWACARSQGTNSGSTGGLQARLVDMLRFAKKDKINVPSFISWHNHGLCSEWSFLCWFTKKPVYYQSIRKRSIPSHCHFFSNDFQQDFRLWDVYSVALPCYYHCSYILVTW